MFFVSLVLLAALLAIVFVHQVEKRKLQEQMKADRSAADNAVLNAASVIAQMRADYDGAEIKLREHYQGEAQRMFQDAEQQIASLTEQLQSLQDLAKLGTNEVEIRAALTLAFTEAEALRNEASLLIEQAKALALQERTQGQKRMRELMQQGENFLSQATRDASAIVEQAEKKAVEIGGDAYLALREKQNLEMAITAIQNVVNGYGDRYIIPTHSLLDDLAEDFGHTSAGERLKAAREHTKRMVEESAAAKCDYSEANRRSTAIRFVVDAFNGRVDAILSRAKHSNYGTLEQEIRDAFALVNHNGEAFRNARIVSFYLDARLDELRWGVVCQELRLKEREEQRLVQEQIREEEKARREYERALQEAAKEEEMLKRAMERAREEAAKANEGDRVKIEAEMAELQRRLAEAEAKSQRAISMAQQTRAGHVYVISNPGSFGDEVFKIGLTRRLEPLDRVKELGDASVPFPFDVHAIIYSEDAPSLERLLHSAFDDHRINKVNYRKEFFRVPLDRLRTVVAGHGLEATFTMLAEAREYRETVALEKMSPEERLKYRMREQYEALQ